MTAATIEQRLCIETTHRVVRELGQGKYGVTFEVYSETLGSALAVKAIDPERFDVQEARLLTALHHPNIVRIRDAYSSKDDYVRIGGQAKVALVMDYIKGSSLWDLHQQGLGRRDLHRYAHTLSSALQYLHQAGIVHRDIGPDNVLVDKLGEPKIIDFGAATHYRENLDERGNPAFGGSDDMISYGLLVHFLASGKHLLGSPVEERNSKVEDQVKEEGRKRRREMWDEQGHLRPDLIQKVKAETPYTLHKPLLLALGRKYSWEEKGKVWEEIQRYFNQQEKRRYRSTFWAAALLTIISQHSPVLADAYVDRNGKNCLPGICVTPGEIEGIDPRLLDSQKKLHDLLEDPNYVHVSFSCKIPSGCRTQIMGIDEIWNDSVTECQEDVEKRVIFPRVRGLDTVKVTVACDFPLVDVNPDNNTIFRPIVD